MLSTQTITVQLPDALYRQVQARARRLRRTVEGEVIAVLAAALPTLDDLPAAVADEMTQLVFLPDTELWRVAHSELTAEENERMHELLHKRQRIGLSAHEEDEAEELLRRYDRVLLLRAQSMALLKERGHDVSDLLPTPALQ